MGTKEGNCFLWKYEKQYPKRIFVLKIWEMIRKEITIANFMTIICLNRGNISHEINYFRTINIFWISKVHMTAKRQLFNIRYSIFSFIRNARLALIVTNIYLKKYNSTRFIKIFWWLYRFYHSYTIKVPLLACFIFLDMLYL